MEERVGVITEAFAVPLLFAQHKISLHKNCKGITDGEEEKPKMGFLRIEPMTDGLMYSAL